MICESTIELIARLVIEFVIKYSYTYLNGFPNTT